MKIYFFESKPNQAYLYAPAELDDLCGPNPPRSLAAEWSPPTFEIIGSDEYRGYLPKTDFPMFLPSTAFLSARAVERLRPILIQCGEILPVHISNDRDAFYLFNVTTVLNAIDMRRSKFKRFPDGKIMVRETLVFDPTGIPDDAWFFKTTQLGAVTEIFATDAAVTAVKQARLTGCILRLAWSGG
jgi:hypothetical protein